MLAWKFAFDDAKTEFTQTETYNGGDKYLGNF